MKTYSKVREEMREKMAEPEVVLSHACAANGCPNAGTIDGTCYWHWKVDDRARWDAITLDIRHNFEAKRNHGPHPLAPMPAAKASKAPKAWAETLRGRERLGEPLTRAQATMWRTALGHEGPL